MDIIEVNPDTDNFQESLGIPESRNEALEQIMTNAANKTNNLVQSLIEIAKNVDNDNERAFCFFQFGANIGVRRYQKEMLQKAMHRMLGD